MIYVRKTRDYWMLMSNYGFGWGVEVPCYYDRKEAVMAMKLFRDSHPHGRYYLKKNREKIERKERLV